MSYVHRYSAAAGCWTVGHYDGDDWEPVSDHDTEHAAADEAARLNGCAPIGSCTDRLRRLLGTELTCADMDALDDDALRSLRNLLGHWHDMTQRRMQRRQQARRPRKEATS